MSVKQTELYEFGDGKDEIPEKRTYCTNTREPVASHTVGGIGVADGGVEAIPAEDRQPLLPGSDHPQNTEDSQASIPNDEQGLQMQRLTVFHYVDQRLKLLL